MRRRKFITNSSFGLLGSIPSVQLLASLDTPFFTTGIKIGEVTPTAAIVWARLTMDPIRIADTGKVPSFLYLDEGKNEWHDVDYFKTTYKQDRPDREVKVILPAGIKVEQLDGAVPGRNGFISVQYKSKGAKSWANTPWIKVDQETDYACQFLLEELTPSTSYEIKVIGKTNEKNANHVIGSFITSAEKNDIIPVNFVVTTCHEYHDQDLQNRGGFKIMGEMQKLQPQFLVHTGDILYHDHFAKNLALARWNWQRMNSLPSYVSFYNNINCYFMKDDHDTWMNDCYPASTNKFMGEFTYKQGVELFRQQVPSSAKPYRSFRWGKEVEIWLFDVREYRKSNEMEDGPEKTIWGKEQMEWFKQTYASSDATFKILISPTPIIGPDRPMKRDNHSNKNFTFEGDVIRNLIAGDKNTFVVCGDRHWQYVSKHSKTKTYEFACGPASNEHAGGWKKDERYAEHEYLNIVGGFLRVEADRQNNKPFISFSHYSVDGNLLFQKKFS